MWIFIWTRERCVGEKLAETDDPALCKVYARNAVQPEITARSECPPHGIVLGVDRVSLGE